MHARHDAGGYHLQKIFKYLIQVCICYLDAKTTMISGKSKNYTATSILNNELKASVNVKSCSKKMYLEVVTEKMSSIFHQGIK